MSVVAQALQGGDAGHRQRRRLLERELRGLDGHVFLASHGVLSECAVTDAENSSPGFNRVTAFPTASTVPDRPSIPFVLRRKVPAEV